MRAVNLFVITPCIASVFCSVQSVAQTTGLSTPSLSQIAQHFASPPSQTLPMVRWWWFGVAVQKPELLLELQQMKADGFGGAELAFVYPQTLDDSSSGFRNLPFMSPDMLDAVRYAQTEGNRLGLRIDVTLCSGWPYGGPAITLKEAVSRLRVLTIPLPPSSTSFPVPKLSEGESLISSAIAEGNPHQWNPSTAKMLPVGTAIPRSDSPRVALIFIASHTLQQVKRAAVGAEGYVLDPFSKQAVRTHLQAVGEPLVKAFGTTPPFAIFSDSLEAYGADWTPSLPAEFLERRGYDLLPHLPELVAGGSPEAEKVRHDYGRTLTELIDENYLKQIDDWALLHKTRFRSQTYGEPAVSFSSQRLVDLPEGEGPQWRTFSTLRWASSANHVFGNTVTSGESFTWLHSPVFRATPLDMKAEADIDFIMGENQLIYHGWSYSPPQVGEPGWSLYAAAVFNNHNPWHPVMPSVNQYVARISYLLRQGEPANQIALLLPTDDAWAGFSPGNTSVTEAMKKLIPPSLTAAILSAGYNFDYIDADALQRLGIHHTILVLPPTDRIPIETARKISAWKDAGGKVLAFGRAPSMDSDGNRSSELADLLHRIFDSGNTVPESSRIPDALHGLAQPDLKVIDEAHRDSIGFIRRRLPNADIYFIANTSNRPVTSRLHLATTYASGARWNPETGLIENAIHPEEFHLSLAPYESAVFVFEDHATTNPEVPGARTVLSDLSRNWSAYFTGINKSIDMPTFFDWSEDPATTHYSGEVVYTRSLTLTSKSPGSIYLQVEGDSPSEGESVNSSTTLTQLGPNGLQDPLRTPPGPGMHANFNPPIHEAALVTVNGQAAGTLWHPPYCLNISGLLKVGANQFEVRVYNTALNAWSALPPRDYKPLIAQYGDRFQMQDLDQVKALPSGILGPVVLASSCSR
jgi:hypothetical protein